MRKFIASSLAILMLAACGGEDPDAGADDGPKVPQGTEEAQASFEGFLSSPFISESQAEETRAMVWLACAAFDEGTTWQEFEDQTVADADAAGRTLGALQVSGMRIAAGLGVPAYCPEHSDTMS